MLNELKKHYNPKETNIVYLTIHQPGMVNALNSGGFSLQGEDTNNILSFVMNLFNRFVNSNEEVHLSQGFQTYFKVLSYSHFLWPKNRRKTGPGTTKTYGCKTKNFDLKLSGCVEMCDGFPGNELAFLNKCLLTSVVLAHFSNEYFRTKELAKYSEESEIDDTFEKLKPLFLKHFSRIKQKLISAGKLMLKKITQIQADLGLPESGPYDAHVVLPKLCQYFNCQIHVLKNNQETQTLIDSYPDPVWKNNLQQIYLFPTDIHHVVPIISIKRFFYQNRQFCPVCKTTFRPPYR